MSASLVMAKGEPRRSSTHGMGLVAQQRINPGELVISEQSILERHEHSDIDQADIHAANQKMMRDISGLDRKDKNIFKDRVAKIDEKFDKMKLKEFIGLLDNPDEDLRTALFDVFFDSSFDFLPKETPEVHKLFRNASFLNHSCDPNAEASWDDEAKCINVYAIKYIENRHEIVISYIDHFNERAVRHQALGFSCRCPICLVEQHETFEYYETLYGNLGYNFSIIDAFKRRHFPTNVSEMHRANLETLVAMYSDPGSDEASEAAFEITEAAVSARLTCSKIADAFEMQYVFYAATAFLNPDNRVPNYNAAIHSKVEEMVVAAMCLGNRHPRFREATTKLLNMLDKWPSRVEGVNGLLCAVGAKVRQRNDGSWILTRA